ncbi:hypothetical protein [Streptomyces caatingaensis]|uniref:Integral membrane protein n=1 Tax=Streptomyces caatingaensis TaxID=1678637 RepID=A0A0K9XJV7_9ACTN|nr:hypothetical protein [Streptomyces caatingaensis]KNB53635.1 hypothetical protein AC230_03150 [Streptomyces caatingaensis]
MPSGRPARAYLPAVALAFAALQLCYAVVHMDLGWDETVYLSQTDPHRPAAFFSAPRSRGISLLAAPVVALTSSVPVLRVVLALLSSAGLLAAYRVWEPLLSRGRAALAALLFCTLWTTVLYGPQAMPNLWVALAAVAAVGWFLRARREPGDEATPSTRREGEPGDGATASARGEREPEAHGTAPTRRRAPTRRLRRARRAPDARRAALTGLTCTLAAATLFRAHDGVWLALPMLAACAAVPAWRRPGTVAAVLGGLALGGVQWAVEAYARFGGIGQRLRVAGDTEGGLGGAHLGGGLRAAYRSLDGPQLCRPCHIAAPPVSHTLWWLLLPVLAAVACALAARRRTGAAAVHLPVACALLLAAPYLLLLDYAAPRFLLPSYALLALPVADLAVRAARTARPPVPRRAVALLLCAAFAGHLVVQVKELRANAADARDTTVRYRRAARELGRLGLSAPCLVTGPRAQPIGYEAGCASAQTMGNNRSATTADIVRAAARRPVALLYDPRDPYLPPYARNWRPHRLPGTDWLAYVPLPSTR